MKNQRSQLSGGPWHSKWALKLGKHRVRKRRRLWAPRVAQYAPDKPVRACQHAICSVVPGIGEQIREPRAAPAERERISVKQDDSGDIMRPLERFASDDPGAQ